MFAPSHIGSIRAMAYADGASRGGRAYTLWYAQRVKILPSMLRAASAALLSAACLGSPSPPSSSDTAAPAPTLLPPPAALSSPAPEVIISPGPLFVTPAAAATPLPPPPTVAPPGPAAEKPSGPTSAPGGRVTVANTEGQGANMRTEPAASATLVRSVREGTTLDLIGPDVEAGGRRWRNVRNPADGATGWIVADLLAAAPGGSAPAASQPPSAGQGSAARQGSAGQGSATAASVRAPASPPVPAAASASAATRAAAGGSATGASGAPTAGGPRIDDADRAYLSAIKPHLEALDGAITSANAQVSAVELRPGALEDPAWREATEALAQRFVGAGAGLRGARVGPNTGDVREPATRAADRADEIARILTAAVANRDARAVGSVRPALVRLLSEIANMNRSFLELQA